MQCEETTNVCCCCCVSGNVNAIFRINKRGYVPGENIIVFAQVNNESNTTVDWTKVVLKQVIIVISEGYFVHRLKAYELSR